MTLGYWIEAAGRGALRPIARTDERGVELDALCTGVSPGTERLVGLGKVPRSPVRAIGRSAPRPAASIQ